MLEEYKGAPNVLKLTAIHFTYIVRLITVFIRMYLNKILSTATQSIITPVKVPYY